MTKSINDKENGVNACRYLLEQGADKYLLDSNGKTAYDYALENKNEDMITLFKGIDYIHSEIKEIWDYLEKLIYQLQSKTT